MPRARSANSSRGAGPRRRRWHSIRRSARRRRPPRQALEKMHKAPPLSQLSIAAARADLEAVRALLDTESAPDGAVGEADAPLWHVCSADAPAGRRIAVATALLDAGAHVRRGNTDGRTALHAAAA